MGSMDKKLYGSYPHPYQSQEYLNGYSVVPRAGPDNIELIMQGWQGMQSAHQPGGRNQYPQQAPQQVQHQPYYPGGGGGSTYAPSPRSQAFSVPSAGIPTNNKYGVYAYGNEPGGQPGSQSQMIMPAGQHRHMAPGEIPRSNPGVFRDSVMHDHVKESFREGPLPSPGHGRAAGAPMAVHRNQDSLEAFMGGMVGMGNGPKDKEVSFDNYYGQAHAGKATISHLSPMINGLQGPTQPLDAMPHMRTNRVGHTSGLESNLEGGYIPSHGKGNALPTPGLRVFVGQPQTMDHLHVSPTGLTAHCDVSPTGPRNVVAAAKSTNIAIGGLSVSNQGGESGYPAMRVDGPYAGRKTFSQLAQKEQGIIEAGQEPMRHNPHAGKNGFSQLTSVEGSMTGAANHRAYINPHAGKSQASQLTHSNGCMTIVPQVGQELRKPAPGDGRWSTTYDDTYTTVQVSNQYAAMHDVRPQKF